MKINLTKWIAVGIFLLLVLIIPMGAAAQSDTGKLSPNIPLTSYIYTDLNKLDGLGLLKVMPTGTKPYTRMQVAGWVKTVREQLAPVTKLPAYTQTILDRLEAEFHPELAFLEGKENDDNGIFFRELNVTGSYYNGEPLNQETKSVAQPKSTYQPLVNNNNGYKLAEGCNAIVSSEIEGATGDWLLFSLTPRLSLDGEEDATLSLESGYLKTHYKNLLIQLGKDAFWWGPGERGNLSLTNNATPFTALQLSNLEPIRPDGIFKMLKQLDVNAFYADLEANRSDVKSPGFFGLRIAATPGADFTISGTINAMAGGVGHELHLSDLGDFITGKNAATDDGDKWNSIAGFDFRWRIPRLNGLQLYGEVYGEDQAGKIIPLPSKNACLWGIDLPRLTKDGRWDLQLETARTTFVWYVHSLYKNGYTYKDNIIGDAMGTNAKRYYAKLSRYLSDGSNLAWEFEHLIMDQDGAAPQKVNSIWLSYYRNIRLDLTLYATVGYADIDNRNYQAGLSGRDSMVSVGVIRKLP